MFLIDAWRCVTSLQGLRRFSVVEWAYKFFVKVCRESTQALEDWSRA